jgi:hypothetical protein
MSAAVSVRLAYRATELLGDGEWHNYDAVLRELVKLIPPGEAIRKAERVRVAGRKQRKVIEPDAPRAGRFQRESSDLIRSGARVIVRDFLRNDRVFEADPKALAPGQVAPDRRIRMIGKLRWLSTEPLLRRNLQLEYDLTIMRERAEALAAFLMESGHAAEVKRLAPELYQEGS